MGNWKQVYQKWATKRNLNKDLQEQLAVLAEDELGLENAFYTPLTFGTGGMRGILGPGTNRMNMYTVQKAVKGLAQYLEESQVNYKDRGVVIAYDCRHMSQAFALECAKVLGCHGIKTYVFSELRPTPLLSFAVRYLGTVAGIMITASHNPANYNGFKVYNDSGSQILLEEANEIIHRIEAVEDELNIPLMGKEELEARNLLEWINGEVDHAYLEQLLAISKMNEAAFLENQDLKIVFTPLHGTAAELVPKGLKQLGFHQIYSVESQLVADPEFSTVASPNPEEAQAFTEAIKLGEQVTADILLATDPDADRLGVAVPNETGAFTILTGNQLGVLLLDYILRNSDQQLLVNARMIKSVVTTELGRAVADSYGVETVDVLTGFKYIGEKINTFDQTGETFVFGFEESYGYLVNSFVRDKDAVQAAVMTCEMALYWKGQGLTLLDALEHLYATHGYYVEGMDSLTLEGKAGQEQMKEIVNNFRTKERQQLGGLETICVEDYLAGKRTYPHLDDQVESLSLPQEDMIKYKLESNCWVCLRPSGTEPKMKWYIGAYGANADDAKARMHALKEELYQIIVHPIV